MTDIIGTINIMYKYFSADFDSNTRAIFVWFWIMIAV